MALKASAENCGATWLSATKKHTTATAPCLQPLVLDKSPEKDDAAAVKTSQEQFHMCQLGWHAVYKKLVCVLYVIILFL